MKRLNLRFVLPDNTDIVFEGITVKECIEHVPHLFQKHYGLQVSCSRHTVYNLVRRQQLVSKLYRQKVFITMLV